ncbi:MAG: glycosyltransferase family 4 protein [Planctomycetota bacterium]|nr:glycosyltransferase family 4 protein [Planctomycetota bacterium]
MPDAPIKVLHLAAADSMLFPILRDQLVYLREHGYDVHTASIDGPLARRLHEEDRFPWTALPLTRSVTPWRDWKAVRFIESLCREQRFQIVHTHTPKGNLVGLWGARRAQAPIVLQTLHGFYFHDLMPWWKRRVWIALERLNARRSDHVLCQNPEDVETALREGIAAEGHISLLGNGIDLARFVRVFPDAAARRAYRQTIGVPPDAVLVGMCGRFVAEKGFPEFLEAGRSLLERHPALHLLVVGHKLESERPGDVCDPASFGVPPGRLTVLANRDDMPQLYASMDVHVLPSHREGFPRVLMEGAAAGLPQVATEIRGCRQTIADGVTGYLVPVRDPAALAERLGKLLADAELRRKMGGAARAKAEREFDQRLVFEKVAACYERLSAAKLPLKGSA